VDGIEVNQCNGAGRTPLWVVSLLQNWLNFAVIVSLY
jgi:hypothetical protein